MPAQSAKISKKTTKGAAVSATSFRQKVEQMYPLHLAMLLVLVSLSALLVTTIVRQQAQIDSLEFRLNFMQNRWEMERAKAQDAMMKPSAETMKSGAAPTMPKSAPARQ